MPSASAERIALTELLNDFGKLLNAGEVSGMSLMVGRFILCISSSRDHLVSKTHMTRVEGENTRLRHYLARLRRKTLCYSKSVDMLKYSIRLLLFDLKFKTIPASV